MIRVSAFSAGTFQKIGIDSGGKLCYNVPWVQVMVHILGCRQAVRHQTLTLALRRFESGHPSQI